jgi:hypothetical protein
MRVDDTKAIGDVWGRFLGAGHGIHITRVVCVGGGGGKALQMLRMDVTDDGWFECRCSTIGFNPLMNPMVVLSFPL